ncbi:MAG: hypothetical protein R6V62_09490 [Candidatus Fermentibacteraceae bacterium]
MRKVIPLILVPLLFLAALAARSHSPGVVQANRVNEYLSALSESDGSDSLAWGMLTDSLGLLASPVFLSGLDGLPAPDRVFMDGTDSRGIRWTAVAGQTVRVVWLEKCGTEYRVCGDSSLDGLFGGAVLLCREAALSGSPVCPVSGRPYEVVGGVVICPSGHLGGGFSMSPDACRFRREEVAVVVRAFVARGYAMPPDLESIFTVSGGSLGQRGGWRCPENGYSYYFLRDDSVVCGYHDASAPVNP